MTRNVGTLDRILRAALGLVLLGLAFFSDMALMQSTMVYGIAIVAGVVMLLTAALRTCPLYSLFGIRTCPISQS